jgi:hypothetical protein
MNLINRDRCAVSGFSDLEYLYEFPNFPVFMGCSNQPQKMDLKQNMSWWISRGSGLIQLKRLLPLDILYPESHGAGAIGVLWGNHHRTFASFLNKFSPTSVLEIGGAHGILANEYHHLSEIPWTILEPNPSPVDACKARFIKGFFNDNFKYSDEFDTIVHSHVFEHIYNPDDFMVHLSGFMREGQNLVFSLPNMQVMLERKYTNCINFEHTVFLTEPYVEYLLAKHGFSLNSKEYFMEDHSIFFSAIRDPEVKPMKLPHTLYEKNKRLYLDYVDYHKTLIADLNQKMSDCTHSIFLFGAHVFAQYLLEMGLNADKIVCLLDNDPNKQGKRLYGTSFTVSSPNILRDFSSPVVILKAGVYNNEIKKQILSEINPNTIFLE